MLYRPLGQSGIQASVVAFGAWAIGGWRWGGTDEDQSVRAIHAAIDRGMTLIDTAPVYGFGLSETIIGRAIQGKRDKVVLATKCGLICDPSRGVKHFTTNSLNFDDDGLIQVNRCCQGDSIRREVEGSLRRQVMGSPRSAAAGASARAWAARASVKHIMTMAAAAR